MNRSAVDEPKKRIEAGASTSKSIGEIVVCEPASTEAEMIVLKRRRALLETRIHFVLRDVVTLVRSIACSFLVVQREIDGTDLLTRLDAHHKPYTRGGSFGWDARIEDDGSSVRSIG